MSTCPECGADVSASRDACECGRDLSAESDASGELGASGESDASDVLGSYEKRIERMNTYPPSERFRICMGFRNPDDVAMTSLSDLRRVAFFAFGLVCFWFTATQLFPPTSNVKLLVVALLTPVLGVGSLLISYTGQRIDYEKYMPQ